MTKIVFENVNLFDGTGSDPFAATVRVEGNRIVDVDRSGAPVTDGDALIIQGGGRTLMPGLTDVHTHLTLGSTVEMTNKPRNLPDGATALMSAHCGRVMLDHGYTSGHSGGGGSAAVEVEVKKAFDAGWVPGPRLVTSSFERLPGGPMGLIFKFPSHETRDPHPEAVAKFVEEMADAGVQAVKFLLNGVSAFDPGANMNEQFYDEEIYAAGVAARDRNVWLTAHCYTAHSVGLAIKAGFRTLYHLTYAKEPELDLIEANKDRLFIGPAPGIVEADLLRAPRFGVMASPAQVEEQTDAVTHIKWVGNQLRKRGVRALPGGDYGFPWNPLGRNARDLELFVEWFGYTPAETLRAATLLGGQAMGMGDELGQVRTGFLADLLLVEGDPTRNIGVLTNKDNLKVIIKDGKIYKNSLG